MDFIDIIATVYILGIIVSQPFFMRWLRNNGYGRGFSAVMGTCMTIAWHVWLPAMAISALVTKFYKVRS